MWTYDFYQAPTALLFLHLYRGNITKRRTLLEIQYIVNRCYLSNVLEIRDKICWKWSLGSQKHFLSMFAELSLLNEVFDY